MKNKINYNQVICICGFLFMFVNMGLASTAFPVFQPYINALPEIGDTYGSWVVAIRMLAAFLATFVSATFYNKLDCRIGVPVASLMVAAGYTTYCLGDSFVFYCIGSIFLGSAYGLGGTVAITLLVGRWFIYRKSIVLAIGSMGSGFASIILPPIATFLITTFSLKASYMLIVGIAIANAALMILLLRNYPTQEMLERSLKNAGQDTGDFEQKSNKASLRLSRTKYSFLLAACFFTGIAVVGSNAYLSVLFRTNNYEAYFVATVLSVCGFSMFIFKFVSGMVTDKLGIMRGSAIFFTVLALGIILLCFISVEPSFLAVAGAILAFAGMPIASVGVSNWAIDCSIQKNRAETIRNFQLCFTFGNFICNLFPGFVYDCIGSYEVSYCIFGASAIIAGAAVVAVYKLSSKNAA